MARVKNNKGGKLLNLEMAMSDADKKDISTIVHNVMKNWTGRKVNSDEEYQQVVVNFFNECMATNEIPTIEKLCVALGITRSTLWDWGRGSQGTRRAELVAQTKEAFAAIDAELAVNNKVPLISYIFRSKNFYGMTDEQKLTIEPKQPLGTETNRAEIEQKYKDEVKALPFPEKAAESDLPDAHNPD